MGTWCRECVDAAVEAYRRGKAPLNSVEGFVRQILGWREFIRGVYWLKMPEYIELNHFDHHLELPSFFWDGETEMNCVRQSMPHVINHGYSHHIQRLMVLGNFAQLWGAHPRLFHEWHMAMYLDANEIPDQQRGEDARKAAGNGGHSHTRRPITQRLGWLATVALIVTDQSEKPYDGRHAISIRDTVV